MTSNKPHIRRVKRLTRNIIAFLNDSTYYARGHVFLDKVVLGLASKGVRVGEAVIKLIEAGFPEEAFGLSRTLVEIALNLRFIRNKATERRAKRFVDYYAKVKMEWILRSTKHFGHKKSQLREATPQYKKLVKLARKFPDRYSWTTTRKLRGGARMMALEPDKHETEAGKPVQWVFDYDWIYFWTSQYVHGTSFALDTHAVLPKEPFKVHVAPERGQHTEGLAVFNTALYLYKILVLALHALGQDLPKKLNREFEIALTSMSNERAASKM